MITRRGALAGAGIIALWSLLRPNLAGAKAFRNLSYGANKLDIYAPENASAAPVVIYVHGGAWRAGSKGRVGSMPAYFNARGYVFASVGYSLRGNVDRQVRDVAQGINWIAGNIAAYGGDPARIAVMGHSAGCHLACLAVLSGFAPGIRSLIANDTGAYDIAYLAEINNGRLPLLYAALNQRNKWRNWSPINYAGGGEQLPVLVAWSGGRNRDRISMRFADRLAAAGHPVTRFDGSNYSHISIRGAVGKRGDRLTNAITQFLEATTLPIVEGQDG